MEFQLLFVDSRPLAFILGGSGDTIAFFFSGGKKWTNDGLYEAHDQDANPESNRVLWPGGP